MRNNYTMANLRPKIMELQERSKELDSAGDDKVRDRASVFVWFFSLPWCLVSAWCDEISLSSLSGVIHHGSFMC
jgi:hypothetical protein